MTATVVLKPRRAKPLFARHPWIFDGAIASVAGRAEPGACVRVVSHEGQFVAYGLYNPASKIRVRLYSWDPDRPVDAELVRERIDRAIRFRHEQLRLNDPRGACRLVFSESDGLSGVIVDRYAEYLVVQFTSRAVAQFEGAIVEALCRRLAPVGIYRRTERGVGTLEQLALADEPVFGNVPDEPITIVEHGLELAVDLRAGQKTGAYLDQRDNRLALCRYAAGRSLLDAFCHTGAFGLVAAKLGAAGPVTGIDVSGPALALARRNAMQNGVAAEFVQASAIPAMQELLRAGRRFGAVVCDPPKFARSAGAVPRALAGYDHLNQLALRLLEPNGILLSCSCSGQVSSEDFVEVLVGAAHQVGREMQILEQRGQAPDHPVALACRQTDYLKCLILRAVD
jgi:23S rRNA (cytosine1962-C5)-methyltransferase